MIINKKIGKLILSIFMVILCFNIFSNTIYAAINQSYKTTANTEATKLDDDMNDDETFLSMTAQVVYIITSGIEWVVSKLVGIFTTKDQFPWADKIIFNAMPMLDVNFINPASYSLFEGAQGTSTAIAGILKNLYYTVFTIGVSFFGVCVGIIALKLIFASIASQKNKYQKALFEVFKSLILLFISYYLISFLFFVNEKLVESASSILLKTLEDNNLEFQYVPKKEYNKEVVDKNASWQADQMLGTGISPKEYYGGSLDVTVRDFKGNEKSEMIVISDESNPFRTMDNKQLIAKVTSDETASDKAYRYIFFDLLSNNTLPYFDKYFNELWQGSSEASVTELSPLRMKNEVIANLLYDAYKIYTILEKYDFEPGNNEAYKEIEEYAKYEDAPNETTQEWFDYYKGKRIRVKAFAGTGKAVYASNDEIVGFLKAVYDDSASRYNNNGNNKDAELLEDEDVEKNKVVLSSMGVYFKSRAYYANMVGRTGSIAASESKANKKYNVVACVLYAIFVVQSIMYFIAYFKRFFYIIILAMLAPLVIVYDFLTKAVNS